jgi:molecular chaperone GrpE
MSRKVSIPVRVVRPTESSAGPGSLREHRDRTPAPQQQQASVVDTYKPPAEVPEPEPGNQDLPREEVNEWRERALRLQAEMENYRKRQQRIAQDQIVAERSRLLNQFLDVVDDLERALAAPAGSVGARNDHGLRRGVELTHRAAMQLLEKEGATAIEAEGHPFDPKWHEAVATVPRNGGEVAAGTVVQVIEPGYRIADRLLRPAKVVVAV